MKRRLKVGLILLSDIIFINAAIFVGYFIRFSWHIPKAYLNRYIESFVPISIIMIISFYVFKLYRSIWRYASIDELLSVVVAVSSGTLASFIYGVVMRNRLPLSVYFVMWALTIMASGGLRFLRRVVTHLEMMQGVGDKRAKRILIFGAGDAGAIVAKEMKKHLDMGYMPVGFIDDDKSKQGKYILGIPILGTRYDLEDIVKEKAIDEIVIAIPSADKDERAEIIRLCNKTGCRLKTLPGIYEMIGGKVTISQIRDVEIEDLLGRDPVELNIEEIAHYLKDKTVLVTGGGGSIGSELCRQIARFNPKKLLILDIYENGAYSLSMELKTNFKELDHEVIIASIREEGRINEIFEKHRPDVVFHAAAHKHVPLMEANPKEAIKNNILGTLNVVRASDRYGVKKFVLISTDKAVNPTNIMGATKRFTEMIIQAMDRVSNTEYVAVRFGNVLGSNGSVIPLFKEQIRKGGPVTVTHPEINRYFMTIPEAAQLVIQAGAMAEGGEIFVLDMGKPVKIVDLARELIRLSGFEPDKDIRIEFTGLRPGEKLYEELLMSEEGLKKTKHKKIFIGKPGEYEFEQVETMVNRLKDALDENDEVIFKLMQEFVKTYKRVEN
ncbi:UDP-N-acetyl-alpha-D-glucosamine C6 dehydratase [Caloramator mitchellensis]|uniref:UDP-N-acetyl-alpha-D-glucosamine C6 dehydratase n=1 Tax=Caloramator mitchellensis TaxID=908809 RepID=A0A0R3K3B4_CALMK|nr:nucleoside-diphosphate sugar epimerase/dehydratase [Caloramator mitchellensis]KRQ87426.1 UDP-N-acetyl-alpha-D-glucosamine C6 dehydratase [Caloramator mitchellensis]